MRFLVELVICFGILLLAGWISTQVVGSQLPGLVVGGIIACSLNMWVEKRMRK